MNDVKLLYNVLSCAGSPDATARSQAEAWLAAQDEQQGYASCLVEIIRSEQSSPDVRWLAAICLKNNVLRHWRPKQGQRYISDAEKAHLRSALLALVTVEDPQVAKQLAVIFGKVGRADFPQQWPSLLEDLGARLGGGDGLTLARAHAALHHVLKALATKRLAADQKVFAKVSRDLLGSYWPRWLADTQALVAALGATPPEGQVSRDLALLAERWFYQLKAMRRLLLQGWTSDAHTLEAIPAVSQLASALLGAQEALVESRPAPDTAARALADKALLTTSKTLNRLMLRLPLTEEYHQAPVTPTQDTHPWSVFHSDCFGKMCERCCGHLAGPGPAPLPEAFLLECLRLLQHLFQCPAYKGLVPAHVLQNNGATQAELKSKEAAMAQAAKEWLRSFWSGGRLSTTCTALITRHLVLQEGALRQLEDDPEGFHAWASASAGSDHLHAGAGALVAALLAYDREAVAPGVVALLEEAAAACARRDAVLSGPRLAGVPVAVLQKEAVYGAVQQGFFQLHDFLEIGPWFRTRLLPEMREEEPLLRLLRWRATLLAGQLVADLTPADRAQAYEVLVGLLGGADLALSLAAIATLRALLDDWDFQRGSFDAYVLPVLQRLVAVLHATADLDTQLQVFGLFDVVLERLEERVAPCAGQVLALLQPVWHHAQGQPLLRIQVLVALQRLVNALGAESPVCYPLLLPLLAHTTDCTQPEQLNLLEDGLQLWLVALRNAPAPHPGLLDLFPNLVAAMKASTEHVQVACWVCTSAVLLGGAPFLRQHGVALGALLASLVGTLNDKGTLRLLPVLELLMCAYPEDGPALLEPALQRLLPRLLQGAESDVVTAGALGLFGRLALQSMPFFTGFCGRVAPAVEQRILARQRHAGHAQAPPPPAEAVLLATLDLYLDKFDSIAKTAARKLGALAFLQFLALPLPAVLERLDVMATHLTSVWLEVEGDEAGGHGVGAYGYFLGDSGHDAGALVVDSADAEGEAGRRRAARERDPAHGMLVGQALRAGLPTAAQAHGPAFQRAFEALPPAIQEQLRAAMAVPARAA